MLRDRRMFFQNCCHKDGRLSSAGGKGLLKTATNFGLIVHSTEHIKALPAQGMDSLRKIHAKTSIKLTGPGKILQMYSKDILSQGFFTRLLIAISY